MRPGIGKTGQIAKWRFVPLHLLAVVLFLCTFVVTAHAEDTSVQTIINSGTLNPALTLTSPTSPATVTTMPLSVEGMVSSLTQIRVYIDDIFSVTIPLDTGATTFQYDLVIPAGTHVAKLVGISPFADISPTVTFSVTYTPPQTNPGGSTSQPTTPTTTTTTSQRGGGVVISHDPTSNSTTTYTPPNYASSLPTWFYNGLVALDIARPNDTDGKELAKTVQRIVLASIGLFFLDFARPAYYLYIKIRYGWLGFNKRPLPEFTRRHPLSVIRTVGVLFISSVFWFV